MDAFQTLADKVSGHAVTDLGAFATEYVNAFARGYNYAFGIAAGAMVISMLVYIIFNKLLPSVEKVVAKDVNKESKAKGNLVSFLLAAGLMATTSVYLPGNG